MFGGFAGSVGYATKMGLPMPELGTAIALAVEIVGGLALLLGLGTRWAALALAFFTLMASVYFHAYWALPADAMAGDWLLLLARLAIVAATLVLGYLGYLVLLRRSMTSVGSGGGPSHGANTRTSWPRRRSALARPSTWPFSRAASRR